MRFQKPASLTKNAMADPAGQLTAPPGPLTGLILRERRGEVRAEGSGGKGKGGRGGEGRKRRVPASIPRSASDNHGPISHRLREITSISVKKSQIFHIPVLTPPA